MGMMGRILGIGRTAGQIGAAVGGVAEVFVGNEAERDAASHAARQSAVTQFGAEFVETGATLFDRFVNGLNRLPRPLLALGTLGLFGYSMAEPVGFGRRMEGLALVPEPLWWLLGAIVSFYFGARELHYQRVRTVLRAAVPEIRPPGAAPLALAALPEPALRPRPRPVQPESVGTLSVAVPANDPDFNAAVEEWRRLTA